MLTFSRRLFLIVLGIFLFINFFEVSAQSIDELEEENQELRDEVEDLLETIEELENQIAEFENQITDLNDKLSELLDEDQDNDFSSFNEEDFNYYSVAYQVEVLHDQYEGWQENDDFETIENHEYVRLENFLYEPKLSNGKNKLFYTGGKVELANYYNYSYSNAKDNFQSFKLIDYLGNTVYFYGGREVSSTKQLIEDINKGVISDFYLMLSEEHTAEAGIFYMATLKAYINPLMGNYEEN